jgi:hypothetical protein
VLRFHRVQLALHARLLQRAARHLRRRGLPEASIELPPLGRLWTAWRGARRSIRETK